jgi:hypothetical protein
MDHRTCDHPPNAKERKRCRIANGIASPVRKPRPAKLRGHLTCAHRNTKAANAACQQDRAVWGKEGPVVLPDIRSPRVREQVRRIAAEHELRLHRMLIAAGMHVAQHFTAAASGRVPPPP